MSASPVPITQCEQVVAGRPAMEVEAKAIPTASRQLNLELAMAVQVILANGRRVTVTGERCYDEVARRLVTTLSSTGTPAFFLSPLQIARGDLGDHRRGDSVVMISGGKTSAELLLLAAFARATASPVIGITNNAGSGLATQADFVICAGLKLKTDPGGLNAWIQSSVLAAMSDAFAFAMLRARSRNVYTRSRQNAQLSVS